MDWQQKEVERVKLEGLIRKRLLGSQGLTDRLARYNGSPAIFFGDAPDDNQKGWSSRETMPRISFSYDTLADKERKSAGSLYVGIYCRNGMDGDAVFPEEIAPLVIRLLKDVIFSPDDFSVFCCTWNRTDSYSVKERTDSDSAYRNNSVIGCDVAFDILEYPQQASTDPDPVVALNRLIADEAPEALVLHHHKIEGFEETSAERPIVYVRNGGHVLDRQTNTVCWMRGSLSIHLLCPDSGIRMKMVTALANRIALAGEVAMLDGSPMFVRAIEGNNSADYLTVGQVRLETAYGVLRTKPIGPVLRSAQISERR